MAKSETRMNEPGIASSLFASDPAFFYNQINHKLPVSYLRTTKKLANPTKPKSQTKGKVASRKIKGNVSKKKVAGSKQSSSVKSIQTKLQKPKKKITAKQKIDSIQETSKKKAGKAGRSEVIKSKKSKAPGKKKKLKADKERSKSNIPKAKAVPSAKTKAARSKSKKSIVASKSIVLPTKKTSRKQIKEEGQISKFASWLQKLDAPQSPSEKKKSKSAYKRAEPKEITDTPREVTPPKRKKRSGKKSRNIDTSIKLGEDIISETLADLLAKQGHTEAAREMYEKLSLINPKKSSLFASKIENLLK